MAPPDRVYRSYPHMPHSHPTSSPEPFGILTTLGHLGGVLRPGRPHHGILGFMLPPDTDDGGGDDPAGPSASGSQPARMPASMAEVSRAEIENLPPYERWLVTLPDDSPELLSFSDPRVGPAPTNPPRQLIGESVIDPASVTLTASYDALDAPPLGPLPSLTAPRAMPKGGDWMGRVAAKRAA